MSTTEDTSSIDEKKNEDTGGSAPDFKGFITNYLSSIVFTIGISVFVIGTLGLYSTKVAQSNILPDNIELAPYTVIDRVVENIPIDINIMRPTFWSENKDTFSQKAMFDSQEYLDSFSNSFLCSLKSKADPKSGANAALFFSRVYDNLVAKNLLAINTIFFYLSYLPESMVMLLYGFFGIFIWMGLYFFNMCISIFYHFINIPELFREASDKNDNGIFEWESDDNISFIRLFKLVLFFFIWIPVGLLSTFIMPSFFTIYGLISPLFATYSINKTKKTYGVYDFIKNTFAYKRFFFFILATLSLFSNGMKYLGSNSVVGILIAVIFAYFMGLYTNEMPELNSDGFTVKIRQNIKQSNIKPIDEKKLVEICRQINIDDDKIKKILQKGSFRQLTKPKEVGGGTMEQMNNPFVSSTNPFTSPDVNASTITAPTITAPTITAPTITTPTITAPTITAPTINTPTITTPTITTPTITTPTITAPTVTVPSPSMTGGKRTRSLETRKKYNIRLV